MRLIVLLVVLIAASIFAWMWVFDSKAKALTSKWVRRAAAALFVAAIVVIAVFGVLSINSWRIW